MKKWIFILLILLIASNGYWLSKTKMFGAFYDEMEYKTKLVGEVHGQLTKIANINVIGKDIEDVRKLLAPDVQVTKPSEANDCYFAGEVCLYVDSNGLVQTVF